MNRKSRESLTEFAEAQASAHLKTLHQKLRHAARQADKAKPIHELRVAIRRFARVLRIFRLLWDRGRYRKIRRRLRKLMDACGAVRNCDVAMEVLDTAVAGVPSKPAGPRQAPVYRIRRIYAHQARLCRRLRLRYVSPRRSKAKDNLTELLHHWKSERTSRSWGEWLRANPEHDQDLADFAGQLLRPLVDEYFEAGDHAARAEATFDDLHKFRLLAKQLRYTLDIFGPLAGRQWKQGVEEVRAIQNLLGELNDCVVTQDLLHRAGHPGSNLLVTNLTNLRSNRFRWNWENKKKSKAWWLRWLCRPRRARRRRA